MERLAVDPARPDRAVIERAAEVLRRGGLVAMPTETVYGLAANALDPRAVERIFAAKARPGFNPLIVHLADVGEISRLARSVPPRGQLLAERFWPGPLTLVVPRTPAVPDRVTAGLDTVGVRVPAHPVALALIRATGFPLAAPSANLFTTVSPTTADHVVESLGDRVDLVLDAGPARVGIESTVIDVTQEPPRLLRPGGISRAAIEAVVGPVVEGGSAEGSAPRPSPGMVERHYAPRAMLREFDRGGLSQVLDEARRLADRGDSARIIALGDVGESRGVSVVRMPESPTGYAAALYATLRDLDRDRVGSAWIERAPSGVEWDAVRDRVRRACAPDPQGPEGRAR